MSRINDALKQAGNVPPRNKSDSLPPLPPVEPPRKSGSIGIWAIIVLALLLAAGTGYYLTTQHSKTPPEMLASANPPPPAAVPVPLATPSATAIPAPALEKTVALAPAPVVAAATAPVKIALPKLQGIVFMPKSPSAIMNGKTVFVGDRLDGFLIKEITRSTVTLIAPDNSSVSLKI